MSTAHSDRIDELKKEPSAIIKIVDNLRYFSKTFPKKSLQEASNKQEEITPFLMEFLNEIIDNHGNIEERDYGYTYALFLLAMFREKQAFPLIIKVASLEKDIPEDLLEDIITEDLHRILASVYNGDINLLQHLIEDKNINTWSRKAALKSLLALAKANVLKRNEIIDYFRGLFQHDVFINNEEATTHLVEVVCDLYPEELYSNLKDCFANNRIDPSYFDLGVVDDILESSREAALKKYLYENSHYNLVNDVIKEMGWWHCFDK